MTNSMGSQEFESYVPVYDSIPEKWDDARPFLVENLKKISTALNSREISFFLDQELLSGKQFIPTASMSGPTSSTSQQFRSILRMVVNTGALVNGANPVKPHGINFDSNFTLIDMWVSATKTSSMPFNAITMSDPQNVTLDSTNININSPGAFDRSYCVLEYTQEI
jgi:hypothetical protein